MGSERMRMPGPRATAAVVDLGLREVKRVGSFDVTGAHVVADGVADDLGARIDEEGEFGLGDGPGGVATDFDGAVGACDLVSDGFEEELGAFGGVDTVVEVAASCVFGFGDAGAATAVVGDSGGPDLLIADGRQERCVQKVIGGWGVVDGGSQVSVKIGPRDERVQGGFFEWVGVVFVMDEEGFCCAVEDPRSPTFPSELM